jgi:hypothetical protein
MDTIISNGCPDDIAMNQQYKQTNHTNHDGNVVFWGKYISLLDQKTTYRDEGRF